jgi:hypothetical protein
VIQHRITTGIKGGDQRRVSLGSQLGTGGTELFNHKPAQGLVAHHSRDRQRVGTA